MPPLSRTQGHTYGDRAKGTTVMGEKREICKAQAVHMEKRSVTSATSSSNLPPGRRQPEEERRGRRARAGEGGRAEGNGAREGVFFVLKSQIKGSGGKESGLSSRSQGLA